MRLSSQSRGPGWPSRMCNSPRKQVAVKAAGRSARTLGTESISWEDSPGWDSSPSSTTQLAPSLAAAKGPCGTAQR